MTNPKLTIDQIPADTDGTMAANSDAVVPSQKAVVTYVAAHGGSGAALLFGTHAARPAATGTTNYYFETDTLQLYQDTAVSTWTLIASQNISDLTAPSADKATPVDADEILLADSAASFVIKKLTWANLKATLKTYFDTLYAGITHASRHQNGGADEVAVASPAANAIPKAGADSTLDKGWVPDFHGSGVSHASGGVPDPGSSSGITKFLREDASWQEPEDRTTAGDGIAVVANTVSSDISNGTALTSLVDDDLIGLWGSVATAFRKITWANFKLAIKAYTDTLYAALVHATRHQSGGADEVATATAGANAIPKAGSGGKLDKGWVPDFVGSGASHASGGVPDPGASAGTSRFLREDGSWDISTSGSETAIGVERWAADGGATFTFPDVVEQINWLSDNGTIVDPGTYTLSADGTQVTFDSAPTAGHVLASEYVIAQI